MAGIVQPIFYVQTSKRLFKILREPPEWKEEVNRIQLSLASSVDIYGSSKVVLANLMAS